jgi:hypothetical protein
MRRALILLAVCLPLVEGGAARGLPGVALVDWEHKEDIATLGAKFYFAWGEYCPAHDANCVNMVRAMQLPRECYPVLLVGNEPDLREPYGYPLPAWESVQKVIAIETKCTQTKLVVGNVSQGGVEWLKEYLAEYKIQAGREYRQALGVHCYGSSEWCIERLDEFRALYAGEWWLTEYNTLNDSRSAMAQLTRYAALHFERYAAYTNRQTGLASDLLGAALVNGDGTLTNAGQGYKDANP